MESTYRHKITTLDGKEKEITLNRMTMRHGLRLAEKTEAEAMEALVDMVSPGTLDIISPQSLLELMNKVGEVEKDFFVQMAKMKMAKNPMLVKKPRKKKKRQ